MPTVAHRVQAVLEAEARELRKKKVGSRKFYKLNLGGRNIHDAEVKMLVDTMQRMPLVSKLDLSRNEITREGVEHLITLMRSQLAQGLAVLSAFPQDDEGAHSLVASKRRSFACLYQVAIHGNPSAEGTAAHASLEELAGLLFAMDKRFTIIHAYVAADGARKGFLRESEFMQTAKDILSQYGVSDAKIARSFEENAEQDGLRELVTRRVHFERSMLELMESHGILQTVAIEATVPRPAALSGSSHDSPIARHVSIDHEAVLSDYPSETPITDGAAAAATSAPAIRAPKRASFAMWQESMANEDFFAAEEAAGGASDATRSARNAWSARSSQIGEGRAVHALRASSSDRWAHGPQGEGARAGGRPFDGDRDWDVQDVAPKSLRGSSADGSAAFPLAEPLLVPSTPLATAEGRHRPQVAVPIDGHGERSGKGLPPSLAASHSTADQHDGITAPGSQRARPVDGDRAGQVHEKATVSDALSARGRIVGTRGLRDVGSPFSEAPFSFSSAKREGRASTSDAAAEDSFKRPPTAPSMIRVPQPANEARQAGILQARLPSSRQGSASPDRARSFFSEEFLPSDTPVIPVGLAADASIVVAAHTSPSYRSGESMHVDEVQTTADDADESCSYIDGCVNMCRAALTSMALPPKVSAPSQHALHTLIMSFNQITRVEASVLSSMPNLEHLDLSHNLLARMEPSDGGHLPPRLKTLNLSHNHLRQIRGLGSCSELDTLDVSHNHIRSIRGLSHLRRLRSLDVSFNEIETPVQVRALSLNTALQVLSMAHNPFATTSAYRPQLRSILPQLRTLDQRALPRRRTQPAQDTSVTEGDSKAIPRSATSAREQRQRDISRTQLHRRREEVRQQKRTELEREREKASNRTVSKRPASSRVQVNRMKQLATPKHGPKGRVASNPARLAFGRSFTKEELQKPVKDEAHLRGTMGQQSERLESSRSRGLRGYPAPFAGGEGSSMHAVSPVPGDAAVWRSDAESCNVRKQNLRVSSAEFVHEQRLRDWQADAEQELSTLVIALEELHDIVQSGTAGEERLGDFYGKAKRIALFSEKEQPEAALAEIAAGGVRAQDVSRTVQKLHFARRSVVDLYELLSRKGVCEEARLFAHGLQQDLAGGGAAGSSTSEALSEEAALESPRQREITLQSMPGPASPSRNAPAVCRVPGVEPSMCEAGVAGDARSSLSRVLGDTPPNAPPTSAAESASDTPADESGGIACGSGENENVQGEGSKDSSVGPSAAAEGSRCDVTYSGAHGVGFAPGSAPGSPKGPKAAALCGESLLHSSNMMEAAGSEGGAPRSAPSESHGCTGLLHALDARTPRSVEDDPEAGEAAGSLLVPEGALHSEELDDAMHYTHSARPEESGETTWTMPAVSDHLAADGDGASDHDEGAA